MTDQRLLTLLFASFRNPINMMVQEDAAGGSLIRTHGDVFYLIVGETGERRHIFHDIPVRQVCVVRL